MSHGMDYQRLEEVVGIIARHPDFPGKRDAIQLCLEDIDDRCRQGRLSMDQRDRLVTLLHGKDHLVGCS